MEVRNLSSLDDNAALAECQRLRKVVVARWQQHATWFGLEAVDPAQATEFSGFELGMLALFRYARGEAVPPPLVESFIDELLTLLFAGIASGVLAIPPWHRMEDRPWAHALRLAELRLCLIKGEAVERKTLCALLGLSADELAEFLGERLSESLSPQQLVRLQERLQQWATKQAETKH